MTRVADGPSTSGGSLPYAARPAGSARPAAAPATAPAPPHTRPGPGGRTAGAVERLPGRPS